MQYYETKTKYTQLNGNKSMQSEIGSL